MANDLAAQLIGMRTAATRQLVQYAVLKKSHQMEAAMLQMIDEVTQNAPAPATPGSGRIVDKQA